jgi:hypothetical protein
VQHSYESILIPLALAIFGLAGTSFLLPHSLDWLHSQHGSLLRKISRKEDLHGLLQPFILRSVPIARVCRFQRMSNAGHGPIIISCSGIPLLVFSTAFVALRLAARFSRKTDEADIGDLFLGLGWVRWRYSASQQTANAHFLGIWCLAYGPCHQRSALECCDYSVLGLIEVRIIGSGLCKPYQPDNEGCGSSQRPFRRKQSSSNGVSAIADDSYSTLG